MQGKISIIVPVYKVEEELERCVQSLVNQTYKNIEIINSFWYYIPRKIK